MITIVGSLNYDLVTFTKKVPEGGETFQADAFETHLGGKGLNEAIATARLNDGSASVRMVGKVGADDFGKKLKGALVEAGVDTTHVATVEGVPSGVAVIIVEEDGENRILITAGANGKLRPTDSEYKEIFPENAGYVILQNEYPDTVATINWLHANRPNISIAYNPSPFNPNLISEEMFKKLDLVIVNEGEARDVIGKLIPDAKVGETPDSFYQLVETLRGLLNPAKDQAVIVTMGAKGCVFLNKEMDAPQFIPSRKVERVVDTTGAGDTFFGGVVSQLASGSDLKKAVEFATAASSLVVQKKGAVESIPMYEEVAKMAI